MVLQFGIVDVCIYWHIRNQQFQEDSDRLGHLKGGCIGILH
nr:MAG TPA: hypothetical protein [Caudoviricetes sp.]